MQEILGPKRIGFLIILALLCGGLAWGSYEYMQPQIDQKQMQLRSIKSGIEQQRVEIIAIKRELAQLEVQTKMFQLLREQNFFSDQNRAEARQLLQNVQKEAELLYIGFDIQPGSVIDDEHLSEADHAHLSSPVSITMNALDDTDIYKFVNLLQLRLPGELEFTNMNVEKNQPLSRENLVKIARGQPVEMVKGTVEFTWHSLAPRESLNNE